MKRLRTEKLHVQYAAGVSSRGEPLIGRRYTLTHSDSTGELFLTIGLDYDQKQLSSWQARVMRDEVLGEWLGSEVGPVLHLHCHVSGGLVLGSAQMRYAVFVRELPLVIEALRYGDRELYTVKPHLDSAQIVVHFHSHRPRFDKTVDWGTPSRYL